MKRFFKHLLFIVLSIFLSHQISASSPFFSIEKRVDRVYKLANGVDDALSKLLKNTDYKKFYDDLASGATPRRFANELTIQEEAILKFYTNESYYKFNQALISKSSADDILALEKLFNRTLDKFPASPEKRFRGIGKEELDKILKLKKGDKITYDNFLSTSSEDYIAWRFLRKNQTKTGRGLLLRFAQRMEESLINTLTHPNLSIYIKVKQLLS